MTTMRAKMQVGFVQVSRDNWKDNTGAVTAETLSMHAVAANKYSDDGSDEDNTFAKFTPGASLTINIANPVLFGKFQVGDRFYVDFTRTT